MKRQKEQMVKAQPKMMKKPMKQEKQQPQKKWSGWRNFIDRYCAL
jgi:hypothetical protein